eukprot:199601-Alexandrium_andersonii.AAC.1
MMKLLSPHCTDVKSWASAGGFALKGQTVPDLACQGRPAMATSVKPASVATASASTSAQCSGRPSSRQWLTVWTPAMAVLRTATSRSPRASPHVVASSRARAK